MLESIISTAYVGQYDFWAVPLALPTQLVSALLPHPTASSSASQLSPLAPHEVEAASPRIPDPGEGHSWVVIEAGKQVKTGVAWVPFGRSSFHVRRLPLVLSASHALQDSSLTSRSCNRKPSSRSPSCATSRRRRRRPSRSSRRSCSTRASCASHRRTSPACARTAPSASRRTTRSRPWTGSASRSTARSTSRTRSGGRTTSCARSSRATGSARTPGTRRQRCAPFPSARSPFSSPS